MAATHPMLPPTTPPPRSPRRSLRSLHQLADGEATPLQGFRWHTLALLLILVTCVTAVDGVRLAWLAIASAIHRVVLDLWIGARGERRAVRPRSE